MGDEGLPPMRSGDALVGCLAQKNQNLQEAGFFFLFPNALMKIYFQRAYWK